MNSFDVVIIGGSYAGLSAAMALGRSRRTVLVIDGGEPCNRQTPHSHNFVTQDGERPGAIADKARTQVLRYPTVEFVRDIAAEGIRSEAGFSITTRSTRKVTGKKLIFATGIKDHIPAVPGFSECWGISVVHCPYCHGYELADRQTAIWANGERAFHLASLVRNLTGDVTILTDAPNDLTTEQRERLIRQNVRIVGQGVSSILHSDGHIRKVRLSDGTELAFDAMYASIPFSQHSEIPSVLGCELTSAGHIAVNASQATSVKGVYACGDNSSPMRSVASAVYAGNLAGAMVNREITEEEF